MERLTNNAEDRLLFKELAEQVFSQLPAALCAILLVSVILVLALWQTFSGPVLLAWLLIVWVISLVRFALYFFYHRYSDRRLLPGQWLNLFSAGTILTGIAWGSAGVLFYSSESPQTNVFLAFVLGGLIAGAASSLAVMKITMRLFTALLLLPIISILIFSGNTLQVAMGIMLMVYGGAYLVLSTNMGRMLVSSLRLRNENFRENSVRKRVETELMQIRGGLEQTVDQRTRQLNTVNEELSREIDERLQAEALLKESEERYRSLVESSRDWIWEVERDGVYTFSSPSVKSILGYDDDEVVGKTFYDIMPPDEAERIREIFESNREQGQPFDCMVNRVLHRDGSERLMETSGEPVFDSDGNLTGYRGIDRDITFRVKHEEEIRKVEHLRSLGLLAGGIAHDFNNLLTTIFGNIELARLELAQDSAADNALNHSVAAMGQAMRLTGQLLTFAQGGGPVLETASIRDLVIETCQFVLSGSAIECRHDIPANLWMAEVDQGQIGQVLNNILTNAREAMPDGGLVRVAAENVVLDDDTPLPLSGGNYLKVSVEDQGWGISAVDLHRVFDPYFSTKKRGSEKGTGIGLTVCHSVIEKHGGCIKLESVPGEGTTVIFYLPALADEADHRPLATVAGVRACRSCRVLLMEDDELVVGTTTRILEHLGHTVEVARHGAEAIDLFSRPRDAGQPFDLLLLDLTIRGGMGGREAVKKLKEIDPDVAAVVTSGYADNPVIANCVEYGFNASLVKPFNIKTLNKLINDLFSASAD